MPAVSTPKFESGAQVEERIKELGARLARGLALAHQNKETISDLQIQLDEKRRDLRQREEEIKGILAELGEIKSSILPDPPPPLPVV